MSDSTPTFLPAELLTSKDSRLRELAKYLLSLKPEIETEPKEKEGSYFSYFSFKLVTPNKRFSITFGATYVFGKLSLWGTYCFLSTDLNKYLAFGSKKNMSWEKGFQWLQDLVAQRNEIINRISNV